MGKRYIYKIIALVVILLLTLPLTFTSAQDIKTFQLVDFATDITYNITVENENVTITTNSDSWSLQSYTNIYACCVYNGAFGFLGYTVINDGSETQSTIHFFDTLEGTESYLAIPDSLSESPQNFATDKYLNAYLVSNYQTNTLYCYSKSGLTHTFEFKNPITQVLCLDGEHITVVSWNEIYVIKGGKCEMVDESRTYTPFVYTGGGILTDAYNDKFTYYEGNLIKIVPETEPITEATQDDSSLPIIHKGKYIIIPYGTTVSQLRKALGLTTKEITVTKPNGKIITSGKLGTGMKIEYDGLTKYTVIIGDLTSEGNINSRDLKLMMKLLSGEEAITEILSIAGDLDGNDALNTKDLLSLAKLY